MGQNQDDNNHIYIRENSVHNNTQTEKQEKKNVLS